MILMLRPEPDARTVVEPEPSPFRLFLRHLQAFPPPDPLHPLVVHLPSFVSQKPGDQPVAIAPVCRSQRYDACCHQLLLLGDPVVMTLCGPLLTKDLASPSFGDMKRVADMGDCLPLPRRA